MKSEKCKINLLYDNLLLYLYIDLRTPVLARHTTD